jgi:hypothetical protein
VQEGHHNDGMTKRKRDVKFIDVLSVLNPNHCLLKSARITRFIATFAASSPGSSSNDAAELVVVAGVVFVFLRPCPRRFVDGLSSPGIAIDPPGTFGNSLFTDGLTVVASPDGRTGATALTFEAIHAK